MSAITADEQSIDDAFMRRALLLAARGAGHVAPNPMVGALVVREGAVVGEGWHAQFGGPHAEVVALAAAGAAAKGATVYVTLEPCAHHGKTPPCTGALLASGVTRVVFAAADPNPVAAGGAQWLRDAGVSVQGGVLREEAEELMAPFLHVARGAVRPFVTLKLALSIDGAIVGAGRRGWLTGAESRRAVHELRALADAVAVGIGTVLADDPALTVREGAAPRVAPVRVVFDRQARLPVESVLARTVVDVPVVVLTDGSHPVGEAQLRERGVEVVPVGTVSEALAFLRKRGVQHLLVEGGATLATALLEAKHVDRLITFQAPVILGAGALAAFATLPGQESDQATRLRVVARRELGDDLMTTYAITHAISGECAADVHGAR
jgi:diaminohydroxyphosphoribosylaminopyrimidine deaminase/5-amino-6-(5-phosphoribosylamino)uracil reductase